MHTCVLVISEQKKGKIHSSGKILFLQEQMFPSILCFEKTQIGLQSPQVQKCVYCKNILCKMCEWEGHRIIPYFLSLHTLPLMAQCTCTECKSKLLCNFSNDVSLVRYHSFLKTLQNRWSALTAESKFCVIYYLWFPQFRTLVKKTNMANRTIFEAHQKNLSDDEKIFHKRCQKNKQTVDRHKTNVS